uniref:EGF-like domain-containing protein n=2 Tax=Scylla olivacea TaxID=85551 RepID=A0A0P4VXB9_SCYOL
MVLLLVDLCSGGSLDTSATPDVPHNHSTPAPHPQPEPHTCRAEGRVPSGGRFLDAPGPLQVGGLAHPPPPHAEYGWPRPLADHPFTGCLRNLRVNGELVDLGESLLSHHSDPGCPAADCASSGLSCGPHGRCSGSPGSLQCECLAGWGGEGCTTPTQPTSFLPSSYVRLALSFTPLAHTTSLQLRFRTRQQDGQLLVLSSQHSRDRLSLQLAQGHLCLLLHLHPHPPRSLCLSRVRLTDGRWHVITASRHGSTTLLAVDEGDGDLYNASVSLGDSEAAAILQVDRQVGLHVGGLPEYAGVSVIKIHGDYHDGCVDDVRVSGRVVPLPPAANSTPWGQASMFQGVRDGCTAPPACTNVTCRPPLICVDTWRSYHCGCGAGQVLSGARDTCEDEDECAWDPCLHGGTCINKPSGFLCQCASGFSGRHCHLPGPTDTSLRISLTALVATVAWSVLLLLVVCALLLHQHHRRAALRRGGPARVNGGERGASPSLARPNPHGANGQPAWTTAAGGEPDVVELQGNHRHPGDCPMTLEETGLCVVKAGKRKGSENGVTGAGERRRGGCDMAAGDDLRNYSYEGEGSSPGSLSSCLESCGGSAKFLGGFREVARVLESWEPSSVRSTHSTPTKTDTPPPPTTTLCPTHHASPILSHHTTFPPTPPALTTHILPPPLPVPTIHVSSEGVSKGFLTPES